MLNKVWLSFFLIAFMAAMHSWLLLGDVGVFSLIVESIFKMAQLSVEIALGLIGVLAFWCGILKLAEHSGSAEALARLLAPLFKKLMPQVPSGHPALGFVSMNMASNMLGLDNAATPVGLKAMQSLQQLNPDKETASNAQILFLVLNTSSVTIFPITIIMYRTQLGAASPTEVFLPILLATLTSTLVGLLAVAYLQKISLFNRVIAVYLGSLLFFVAGLLYWLQQFEPAQMAELSAAIGNGLLFSVIITILLVATIKKVDVYEGFIEGAKEGFTIAITIIPYMVAMLVAIGVLRASGALQVFVDLLASGFASVGLNTDFIAALPTGIMNPLSGSGARAMMLETMNTHGVDSFPAKVASVMQGSTETTFYVLTVYFGSVGIKKIRHALSCGLIADFAGIFAAIILCYWFF
jgi:spore maturation protein SpmA